MAHSLADLHSGLADRVDTITGLRTHPRPIANPSPPCSWVQLADLAVVSMQRGIDEVHFEVVILTGAQVETGYDRLLEYASPTGTKSIRAALWADKTIGLSNTDAYFAGFRMLGIEERDIVSSYGGVFTVRVVSAGS